MEIRREGRVWKFGDDVNTDLIFPNRAFREPLEEQHRFVFSANRPGWIAAVQPGDLIVAGQNFGMGSGRPVGRLLAECGIAGVMAESVNGLCLRNCVRFGLPALSAPGVTALFDEGDLARVDFVEGWLENLSRDGASLDAAGLPPLLRDLVTSGGIIQMLVEEGFVEPMPRITASS